MKPNGVIHYDFNFFGLTLPLQKLAFVPRFSSLISRGLFRSAEAHFLQVDHTHNELDQRFSTMSVQIKKAECLEDIPDLVHFLKQNMTAAGNWDLVIEELTNTMDFKSFLGDAHMHIQGLTSTHLQPHANHLWRMCSRVDVDQSASGQIECLHPDWKSLQEDPQDVVLIVKQYLSSPAPTQNPQLMLPKQVGEALKRANLKLSRPNEFSMVAIFMFMSIVDGVLIWLVNLF